MNVRSERRGHCSDGSHGAGVWSQAEFRRTIERIGVPATSAAQTRCLVLSVGVVTAAQENVRCGSDECDQAGHFCRERRSRQDHCCRSRSPGTTLSPMPLNFALTPMHNQW